ncbi:hypothetical protein chiPu_0028019, partial [Chiloscyllium punctatum]|nr:hypothetical protein [Chiloscyllium punctatum]
MEVSSHQYGNTVYHRRQQWESNQSLIPSYNMA